MNKYWQILNYEIRKSPNHEYVGTLALKWKQKNQWNLVLYRKGGRQEYITYFKRKPTEKEILLKTSEKIKQKYPKCYIFGSYKPKLPEKGLKLLETRYGEIWLRRSKKGYYWLCLCDGYKIIDSVYIKKEDVRELCKWINYGREDIEAQKKIYEFIKRHGILRETAEKTETNVEDWGYGTTAQEYAENGDLIARLEECMLNGDAELARWLLNSPEDARSMKIPEKIIKWAFGSEDD